MPRDINISRDEAHWLLDILEACDPETTGTWRFRLAAEIREKFGMVRIEEDPALETQLTVAKLRAFIMKTSGTDKPGHWLECGLTPPEKL